MTTPIITRSWLTAFILLAAFARSFAAGPVPLIQAHAHNDYQHPRPLLDALDHGFCSVEADVHLVNGQLLVAHDLDKVKPERTLQALYLDPLRERVKRNGGHVYPAGPEFTLLIEFKSDWQTSYPVLRNLLKQYAALLTSFRAGTTQTNAIRIIITGHHSPDMFAGEPIRYVALDGELPDLDSSAPADLVPWISTDWKQHFQWRGSGPMPEADKAQLRQFVAKAHQHGRRIRFWGAPNQPVFWSALLANGVDLINVDNLDAGQKFLLGREGERPRKP